MFGILCHHKLRRQRLHRSNRIRKERNVGAPFAHKIAGLSVVPPSMAFTCWGFTDVQMHVFCYWLMGGFYTLGSNHLRAVHFYKMVKLLGSKFGLFSFNESCH